MSDGHCASSEKLRQIAPNEIANENENPKCQMIIELHYYHHGHVYIRLCYVSDTRFVINNFIS